MRRGRGSGRGLGAGACPCGNRVGTGGDLLQSAPEFSRGADPSAPPRSRSAPPWQPAQGLATAAEGGQEGGGGRVCALLPRFAQALYRPGHLCLPLGLLHVTYVDFTAEAWGETDLDCEGAEEISIQCGL